MKYAMKIVGFANGADCPIAGCYLRTFDFNAHCGQGDGDFTTDIRKAMTFADAAEVFTFWTTVSWKFPVRRDGRPNRPLTCSTITTEPVPE